MVHRDGGEITFPNILTSSVWPPVNDLLPVSTTPRPAFRRPMHGGVRPRRRSQDSRYRGGAGGGVVMSGVSPGSGVSAMPGTSGASPDSGVSTSPGTSGVSPGSGVSAMPGTSGMSTTVVGEGGGGTGCALATATTPPIAVAARAAATTATNLLLV